MDFYYAIKNMFPQESEIFQSGVLKTFGEEGINRMEGPRQTRNYRISSVLCFLEKPIMLHKSGISTFFFTSILYYISYLLLQITPRFSSFQHQCLLVHTGSQEELSPVALAQSLSWGCSHLQASFNWGVCCSAVRCNCQEASFLYYIGLSIGLPMPW